MKGDPVGVLLTEARTLDKRIAGIVKFKEPLARHTSLRIGGVADVFVMPRIVDDVFEAICFAKETELPWMVIGNGTNMLFPDEGYRGMVMKLGPWFGRLQICEDRLYAQAGVGLASAIHQARQSGFKDLDLLVGIPGTIGGALAMNAGIPEAIQNLTVKFKYNDLESVKALFTQYPNQIACLIMEAETMVSPADKFLHEVKRICHENGALFILDEIITGFRWHLNGAQKIHNIVPDLSTFGKAMGNGFSIAALAGKREIMKLGGLDRDRERVFLLSTTFGAETHSLAAAIEVMRIYQEENVIEHLYRQGEKLITGIEQAIATHQLEGYFGVAGKPCNLTRLL